MALIQFSATPLPCFQKPSKFFQLPNVYNPSVAKLFFSKVVQRDEIPAAFFSHIKKSGNNILKNFLRTAYFKVFAENNQLYQENSILMMRINNFEAPVKFSSMKYKIISGRKIKSSIFTKKVHRYTTMDLTYFNLGIFYLLIAATPGSSNPSRLSSIAPPPVET